MKIIVPRNKLYYSFVFLYLFFTVVITLFSLHLFGDYHSFTNKSTSMNPSIDSGSITIVKKMDMYEVGDVISYYYDSNNTEEIISHRIIQIGGNVYITKGDANLGIDAQGVVPRLIIGKVVMIIPYLGYIVSFAKSTLGVWITIIAPACFISGTELTKVWIALKKPEEK